MSGSAKFLLSESKSKKLLAEFGLQFVAETEVLSIDAVVAAAESIGYPVVIKINSDLIAHKTERGLVKLNIQNADEARIAAQDLAKRLSPEDGETSFLVAKMESGQRELIVGSVRDHQFGTFVMLGIGGVFAEAMNDSVFAPIPISQDGALAMISRLQNQLILSDFRGQNAINTNELIEMLVAVSSAAAAIENIESIDINPVIIRSDGSLVAVDALVEMKPSDATEFDYQNQSKIAREHFDALFAPKGVVVVGASTHPGKFGFVSLHNILSNNFLGTVFATHLDRETVLGIKCHQSVAELPVDAVDFAIICTPAITNASIVEQCAAKGIRAIYVTSAGYAESDIEGAKLQTQLCELANELDVLLVGPNGQGIISTPNNLCAQIVGPYPPTGSISLVSQSGNFVSSFMNYSRQTSVGISRAVSIGNAAQVGVPDFLRYFANDDNTKVALAYIEGVSDGRALANAMSELTMHKPLVIVKGGSTIGGAKAANSHTGAMASDNRIFDGVCATTGAILVDDIECAFDVAATFATQPMPKGNNTVVLTTVGGWGVVTSDQIHKDRNLKLMDLPEDIKSKLSTLLPNRWSKNNPIDCAGGETRETVAEILRLLAEDSRVDAIIFLGMGIQSNQARMMREGRFFPEYGLQRIVNYHEHQDETYANIAAELSLKHAKPILLATELAVADQNNVGVVAVKESGRLCYASGQRAARALAYVYRYAKWSGVAA